MLVGLPAPLAFSALTFSSLLIFENSAELILSVEPPASSFVLLFHAFSALPSAVILCAAPIALLALSFVLLSDVALLSFAVPLFVAALLSPFVAVITFSTILWLHLS